MNPNKPSIPAGTRASLLLDITGTVTIPDDATTPISFPVFEYSTFPENPINAYGQFEAPTAGFYRFNVSIEIDGAVEAFVRLNGPSGVFDGLASPVSGRNTVAAKLSKTFYLERGQAIAVEGYQKSGSDKNLWNQTARNFREIEYLGL